MPRCCPATSATAASADYYRTNWNVHSLSFRARGYFPNDTCLKETDKPCMTSTSTPSYRNEATAQARVIQHLDGIPLPNSNTGPKKVQWEVSPDPYASDPDAVFAPDADSPGPAEPPDTPAMSPPDCNQTTRWRTDIAVDVSASSGSPTLGLIEVKDWAGGDGARMASDQLECYSKVWGPQYAAAHGGGVNFTRYNQLNGPNFWSQAYGDDQGAIWCVWADPSTLPLRAGNVYFATQGDLSIPDIVHDRTPGCDEGTRRRVRKWIMAGQAVTAAVTGAIAEAQRRKMKAESTKTPDIDSEEQEADEYCVGYYTVRAPKDPNRPTTLRMDYGDGAVQTRTIPQGQGSAVLEFTHQFPYYSNRTFTQRATIVETGTYAESTTHHYPSGGGGGGGLPGLGGDGSGGRADGVYGGLFPCSAESGLVRSFHPFWCGTTG